MDAQYPDHSHALENLRQQIHDLENVCKVHDHDVTRWDLLTRFDHLSEQISRLSRTVHCALATSPQRPSPTLRSAVLAAKVFSITELCEKVLLRLDFSSLLQAQFVNKAMHSTIANSVGLQRKTHQLPNPSAYFSSINDALPCPFLFRIERQRRNAQPGTLCCRLRVADCDRLLDMKIGTSRLSMLLCQPPIHSLDVSPNCCHDRTTIDSRPTNRPSRTGLQFTMQFLLSEVRKIRDAHCLCPLASAADHDDLGFVKCSITFTVTTSVRLDDPVMEYTGCDSRLATRTTERVNREVRAERFAAYSNAKQNAHDAGEPIPTLAEFDERTSNTEKLG